MIFSDARLCLVDLKISSIFCLLLVMVVRGWPLVAPPLCLPAAPVIGCLYWSPCLAQKQPKHATCFLLNQTSVAQGRVCVLVWPTAPSILAFLCHKTLHIVTYWHWVTNIPLKSDYSYNKQWTIYLTKGSVFCWKEQRVLCSTAPVTGTHNLWYFSGTGKPLVITV